MYIILCSITVVLLMFKLELHLTIRLTNSDHQLGVEGLPQPLSMYQLHGTVL